MTPLEIWNEALAAAKLAGEANEATLAPEGSRGFDCGFAWLVIKPARGDFIKFAKAEELGEVRSYGGGGFQIWYSKFSPVRTQSYTTHYEAAKAAALVLKKHGIPAVAGYRLD